MSTYVSSLNGRARLAHLGNMHSTTCGYVMMSNFTVTDHVPPGRELCRRCVGDAAVRTGAGALGSRWAARDQALVAMMREGLDNLGVARRLRIGQRTAGRYLNAAQRRAGAKTRWQWGFKCGLAAGRGSLAS